MKGAFGKRIYTLDILRGFAALSVVLWHWQHFFMGDKTPFKVENQPFYDYFSIFYTHGLYAVELFFVISGFIFFYLYSERIHNKKVTLKNFFISRFSRLYPLYFISFVLVLLLQLFYFKTHNTFFVYQMNDTYHAILNLLMIQSWGLEKGWSYNAPTWSVSIEVLMYSLFFLLCLLKQKTTITLLLITSISLYFHNINNGIMVGSFCFFLGGLCFKITMESINKIGAISFFRTSLTLSLLSWLVIFGLNIENIFLIVGIGFSSIICTLAALSATRNNTGKKIEWIGDISYSSYLLHFPLQLIFVIYIDSNGYSRDIFYNTYVLFLFMALLIAISYISHRLIEVPMQNKIRNKLLKTSQVTC